MNNHLVGWMLITCKRNEDDLKSKINLGLNSFVGNFGLTKAIKTTRGFGFGIWKPDVFLPLTTWSLFEDKDNICFIEGVFYDDYFSYWPFDGEDQNLAKILLEKYKAIKNRAIEKLSGSFTGFIFNYRSKELVTFIDRLGIKTLYWSYEKGDIIVSSNLAAFRGLKSLLIDQSASFQFLTLGYPIGTRTLLENVKIHTPCTINFFNEHKKRSTRYWDVPKRLRNISLEESVEMITRSMEDFVERIYGRVKQNFGLGTSGGHDARVVLSALASKDIPFKPIIKASDNFDKTIAQKLCCLIKKDPQILKITTSKELIENIRKEVFAFSDGTFMYSYLFSELAMSCFEQKIKCLILGYAGDIISGAAAIPSPQYLNSIKKLAKCDLYYPGNPRVLSFNYARSLLKNVHSRLFLETMSEWEQSFFNEKESESFLDISIWQGLTNRYFRKIRFPMLSVTQYTQLILPYLDNKVLDAYFSLPIKHLHLQKAHCFAGFRRFKEFGNLKAVSYPISLKQEALFPINLYMLRKFKAKLNSLQVVFNTFYKKVYWNENHESIYNELSESSLYDSNFLEELYIKKRINPGYLYKIHTLHRFYNFYVLGNNK